MKALDRQGTQPASLLLRHYAMLESASEEMLQAARRGDWDSVCRLEAACAVVIARLRTLAGQQAMPLHEQRERLRILRTILQNDAAIRRIAQPLPSAVDFGPAPSTGRGVTLH